MKNYDKIVKMVKIKQEELRQIDNGIIDIYNTINIEFENTEYKGDFDIIVYPNEVSLSLGEVYNKFDKEYVHEWCTYLEEDFNTIEDFLCLFGFDIYKTRAEFYWLYKN